jgi:hypothetical protein
MAVLCPKCGSTGYLDKRKIGNRVYIYVIHVERAEGRRKVRRCYVGPEEGYVHAEQVHNIGLTNIMDQDYVLTAILSLERAVEQLEKIVVALEPRHRHAQELLARIGEVKKRVSEVLRKLDELENYVKKLAS